VELELDDWLLLEEIEELLDSELDELD